MAITQYQIFCRYLNEQANRILTNKTEIEWVSAEEAKEKGLTEEDIKEAREKGTLAIEYCLVEPADSSLASDNAARQARMERELEFANIIIEETKVSNPKYDMVFMYDGLAYAESRTGESDYLATAAQGKQLPYLYYDKMKRVKLDPWFLLSTHASLQAAMTKAKNLVNILGKEGVKIGKVVPLDQYIEIV